MSKLDELATEVMQLRELLQAHGIGLPAVTGDRRERPDFVEHGSTRHAGLLGLVEVTGTEDVERIGDYTSPRSGRTFRLEDEIGALRFYPGIDPEKAIRLVLQQKVNELETVPTVPEDAPPMFKPVAVY